MTTSEKRDLPDRHQNELRVFISSTFRDLHEEREYLVKKTFPKIRALCRERGVEFTEVDLRWGITEESAEDGGAIRICLDEIDRCRPYFIGILGDRYGWVPPPSLAAATGFPRLPWLVDAIRTGTSITELEILHGVLNAATGDSTTNPDLSRALFYFRAPRIVDGEPPENTDRLNELKARIRSSGALVREGFHDVEELCRSVHDDLQEIVERDFPIEVVTSELHRKRRDHAAFAISRTRSYIPNRLLLDQLDAHAASAAGPLMIVGESGSGKSSLLAWWCEGYRRDHPDVQVIEHFVGADGEMADQYSLIRRLTQEIADRFAIDRPLPQTDDEMLTDFPVWLGMITSLTVIALDAVNQLAGTGAEMAWLPKHLPGTILLVVSTTSGTALDHLREREWPELVVEPLGLDERESIIARFLQQYGKSLRGDQVGRIATNDKSALPLFLRTLLEELRVFGSFEELDRQIAHYMGASDVADLFRCVLERLEEDHGIELVKSVLSLIGASRYGLGEHELLGIIGVDRMRLSSLLIALEYHLVRRGGLYTFFHGYLARAVETRYVLDMQERASQHRMLAKYFSQTPVDRRRADEEPWQWKMAGERERFKDCLCQPDMFLLLNAEKNRHELLSYWRDFDDRDEMIASYSRSLHDLRQSGCDPLQVVEWMDSLGEFLAAASCFNAAEPLLREVYRYRRLECGHNALPTSVSMDHLAQCLYHLGMFSDAERLWMQALAIVENHHGPNDSLLCPLLDSLSMSCFRRNDIQGSEEFSSRSLAISEAAFGRDHPASLDRLLNVAELFIVKKVPESAVAILEDIVRIASRTYGERHPTVARYLSEYGYALSLSGLHSQAIPILEQVIKISEEVMGEHIALARALENLGTSYVYTDRLPLAESCFRRAYAIRLRLQGANHADTLIAHTLIASALRRQGEVYKAEEILRHVLPKQEALLGSGDYNVHRSISGLILILEMTGREGEANQWRKRLEAMKHAPASANS